MEATTKIEEKKLLEEMLADVKGHSRKIEKVEGSFPSVITVNDEGLVDIYEIATGRKVTILRYMLSQLLQTKRFTTAAMTEKRGNMKCLLHPDSENREHYNELGLPLCLKSNITSKYQVEQHMKKRHPSAWAAIEQERKDFEKQEEREFQRTLVRGTESPDGNKKLR